MKKYCLDTNVFIEPWNKYYSPQFTKGYWSLLHTMAGKGVIFSPAEVKREIEKTDDELLQWLRINKGFFKEPDNNVQIYLKKIMKNYPRLVVI